MKRKILKKTALFFCIFGILNFSSLYSANFQDVLNKPFPDWMKNQIQECLDPFTNELSEEYLDQLFNNYHQRFQLMRIKYFNKKLFFQTPTKHIVNVEWKKIFNRLHRLGRLPPYDSIF